MTTRRLKIRKFTPLEREYPVFEVMDGDEVLFDVSKTDAGVEEIAFHRAAAERAVPLAEVLFAITRAREALASEN
jgi:hypothetical protein